MSTHHRITNLLRTVFAFGMIGAIVLAAPVEAAGRVNGSVTNADNPDLCSVKITLRGWTPGAAVWVTISGNDGTSDLLLIEDEEQSIDAAGTTRLNPTPAAAEWGKPHIVSWTFKATDGITETTRTVLNRCADPAAV